jgi:hypothetical protein
LLAVIEFGLIFKAIKLGPTSKETANDISVLGGDSQRQLTMAY